MHHRPTWILTLAIATTLASQTATAQEFGSPTRVTAKGTPIDVTIGHAAPFMRDMNGDGVRDLLVGEFGNMPFDSSHLPEAIHKKWGDDFSQGKLRIYHNAGSNTAPIFKEFKYLQAGGKDASIPAT